MSYIVHFVHVERGWDRGLAGVGQIFRGDHSYIVYIFDFHFDFYSPSDQNAITARDMEPRYVLRKLYCLINA